MTSAQPPLTFNRLLILLLILPALVWSGSQGDETSLTGGNADMTQNQIRPILDEADRVFKSRDYDGSREIYLRALTKAEQDGDNPGRTEALSMIARTYLITDRLDSAAEWLDRAGAVARESEPMGYSRFLSVKGRQLWQKKKLDEAAGLFKKLYAYCSEHKLHERAIDAAHMVAITGDHDTQVEWARKGIAEAEAGGVTGWLGPLWNNLGVTYEEMGRYDSSLEAYQKACKYHHLYGDEKNKVIADWAVGHAYANLKDAVNAEKWLLPALEQFERQNDSEFIGLTCRDLGEIACHAGDYKKALDYLVRAEELLKQAGMDQWDEKGYQKLLDRIADVRAKIK